MRLDGLLLRLDNCRILLGSRFFVAFEPAGPLSRPYTGYRYTSLTSDHSVLYFYLFHFLLSSLYGTYLYYLRSQTAARATTRRDAPRSRRRRATRAPPRAPSGLGRGPAGSTAGPGPDRARPRSADAIGIACTVGLNSVPREA